MRVKKYYKLIRVDYEDTEYMRLKNVSNEAGIFKMVKTGNPTAPNLEYSLDGVTWTTYNFSTLPEVTVAAGANIYFRGTNTYQQFNTNQYSYVYFSFNKTCEGHGNMCSLFNPDPAVFSTITSIGAYGLTSLFKGCTSLTTAPDFSSVTSIGDSGLNSAFSGCTSLTTAPDFSSVTTVGGGAFYECFDGCISMAISPDFSSLLSVGNSSFMRAFNGCTSMTVGPDFSHVDTLVGGYNFSSAFKGCSHLYDVTAPNIQDLTPNNILDSWLMNAGTQATGTKTVRVPTGATIATGSDSGIPTGWTRVDY